LTRVISVKKPQFWLPFGIIILRFAPLPMILYFLANSITLILIANKVFSHLKTAILTDIFTFKP